MKEQENNRHEALKKEIELIKRDQQGKNPILEDIYELFESRVNFHGFEDPYTQSRDNVQDLKCIGKNVSELGLFQPRKLIADGYLILQRENNQIVPCTQTMNSDSSGNFIIRSGQLSDGGKKLNGLGRKIRLNQVTTDDNVTYYNEEKSFVIEGQFKNDSLVGFGRVTFRDQVHSIGFHMDYILHGFGKKLQQDGQILEGFF